jgi:hypothetical protein
MLFLLVGQWLERDLAGKPGPTFPDHAQNLEFWGAVLPRKIRAQKGSPAKRTGHTLLVAAQYSQKSPENNVKGRLIGQNCQAFSGL